MQADRKIDLPILVGQQIQHIFLPGIRTEPFRAATLAGFRIEPCQLHFGISSNENRSVRRNIAGHLHEIITTHRQRDLPLFSGRRIIFHKQRIGILILRQSIFDQSISFPIGMNAQQLQV